MGEVSKTHRTLPYNLRTHNEVFNKVPKTVNYETETISFLAPKVWTLVPEKIIILFESFQIQNQEIKSKFSTLVLENFTYKMLVFFKYAHMFIQRKNIFFIHTSI